MKNPKKGFAFIEILAVASVILFIIFKVINFYFRNNPAFNAETEKALSQQGINTTDYKSIMSTTREKIKNIQAQHLKELEDIK